MVESGLPSIKLRPELLPEVLRIIGEDEGDRGRMDIRIHELFIRKSQRARPPTKKNATRAVTYPSLRRLDLVFGDGTLVRLTARGSQLLEALRMGMGTYQRQLARHLAHWDREGPRILKRLEEAGGMEVLDRLANGYAGTEMPKKAAAERLSRLLAFFADGALVARDGPKVILNPGQFNAALSSNPLPRPDSREFVEALIEEYAKLVRARGSPAVPLPLIEREVTRRFGGRLWSDDFREMIAALPTETPDYILHFSQPMVRESQGIKIGGRYFYYVQVHRRH